jgi:Fe-S-cluster containining protein
MTKHRVFRSKSQGRSPLANGKPNTSFDLRSTSLTDISEVKLDSSTNQCSVQIQVPINGGEAYALYEEVLDFDEHEIPGYLLDASRRMYEAALRAVRERVYTQREVPCATCTGNCCGRNFVSVRLTAADIERLQEVVDIGKQVVMYEQSDFSGYVGEFQLVPWYGDEEQAACPNLTPEGCSIYEHRPLICREFSCWDCEIYEEDPDKVAGKIKHKLKVVG